MLETVLKDSHSKTYIDHYNFVFCTYFFTVLCCFFVFTVLLHSDSGILHIKLKLKNILIFGRLWVLLGLTTIAGSKRRKRG